MGKLRYEKIWDIQVCIENTASASLLYIDRHLLHEVTSQIAFDTIAIKGLPVFHPESILAVADHNIPTDYGRNDESSDTEAILQLKLIRQYSSAHNIQYYGYDDIRQGIVHVVGPEQGITQPGIT